MAGSSPRWVPGIAGPAGGTVILRLPVQLAGSRRGPHRRTWDHRASDGYPRTVRPQERRGGRATPRRAARSGIDRPQLAARRSLLACAQQVRREAEALVLRATHSGGAAPELAAGVVRRPNRLGTGISGVAGVRLGWPRGRRKNRNPLINRAVLKGWPKHGRPASFIHWRAYFSWDGLPPHGPVV